MAGISVTGVASSPDGSATVEVGLGGSLRSVRLSREALSRGASGLARNILDASRRATAQANRDAHEQLRRQLGATADATLDTLGLGYDPELLDEEPEEIDDPLGWRR